MPHIKSIWTKLIKPTGPVGSFVDRQMSQLLASWLLSFFLIILLLFMLRMSSGVATRPELWVRVILCLVIFIAYAINRQGRYKLASMIAVVSSSLIVMGLAAIEDGEAGLQILNYLTVIILFASLFLEPWSIFVVFVLHTLGMIAYDFLLADVTWRQIVNGPLSFNLTVALIIFLITRIRNRLEIERQAKIDWERQRFQHLAFHSPDFICIVNQSSLAIEFVNKETFLGYATRQFDSLHSIFQVVHPQDLSQVTTFWQDVMHCASEADKEIEYRVKRESDEWEWVQNRVATLTFDNNHASHLILSLMTIITERKQVVAAQKLESLGIMAGGVAHDFNNLLVGILGQTSLALHKLPAENAARPHIEKAMLAGNRAASITRQLLAYSGHGRFEIRPLSLNGLIEENISFFQVAIPKHVTMHTQLLPDLPAIEGDEGQIQQLIMNLIINGAEAIGTKPGSVIIKTDIETVESSAGFFSSQYGFHLQPGEYVSLTIRDDGQGMDHETMLRIFEPFFTTKMMGRGLGLAAVLGIVRGHHGGITVQSKLGEGTQFKLLLPMADQQVIFKEQNGGERPLSSAQNKLLVIDDETSVREVVQEIMTTKGIPVLEAADGAAGVNLYRAHAAEIKLVLLDLSMPGMSGKETLAALRKINPDVRVILSSGYSEETVRHQLDTEPSDFLQKPYSLQQLIRKVRQHMTEV